MQRAIVADIVAMYLLLLKATESTAGDSTGTAPLTTFLKKAKAGSVEVEYDQMKIKDSNLIALDTEGLLSQFKNAAIRKAGQLGCIIDINEEGAIEFLNSIMNSAAIKPLFVARWDDCGCN